MKSWLIVTFTAISIGMTMLVIKVLLEHNVIAASRMYETISLKALGELLGLKNEEEAELVRWEHYHYALCNWVWFWWNTKEVNEL